MKICKNCGAEMQDSALFCTSCGTKAEDQAAQSTYTAQGDQTAQTYGSDPNMNQNAGSSMNGNPYMYGGQNTQYGQNPNMNQGYQQYYVPVDPYDHTREFDAKDISDNKVIAMLAYLMGTIGVIVALLASGESPYVAFHVRQSLKYTVLSVLSGLVAAVLFWTFIVPIVVAIFVGVLWICKIIAFVSVCKGQAKEPYIVRSFKFMK